MPELSKSNQENVSPAKEQMSMLRDAWDQGQTYSYLASPFIEKMRCKSGESLSNISVRRLLFAGLTQVNVY